MHPDNQNPPASQPAPAPQPQTDNGQQPPVPPQPPATGQPAPGEEPKILTFSLKETETQLLTIVRNNQNAIFSALLSTIAIDRLGYKVTGHTQFELNAELNQIKLRELAPDVPIAGTPQQAPDTTQAPGGGAVPAA